MAEIIENNPNWILKLSSSSINISAALAKLISYNQEILEEKRRDEEFYLQMKNAFKENAENDLLYSENFVDLSLESDLFVKGDVKKQ